MENKDIRLNADQIDLLQTLYSDYGLEKSLQFLYSMIVVNSTATRMTLTIRHVDASNMLVLGDITQDSATYFREHVTASMAPSEYRSVFFYADTAYAHYFGNIEQDGSMLAERTSEVIPGDLSVFIIPMFARAGYAAYMMFSSKQENIFSEAHLEFFKQCAHVFGEELKVHYFPKLFDDGCARQNKKLEPLEMLRMCNGLAKVIRMAEHVAPTDAAVLILGETGVGKEVLARTIHLLSKRNDAPFIRVNSGAIPESLLLSELFGYERGSFTGAVGAHAGYFEQANSGTLFLDEIGELTPAAQVALLRVLSTGEIQRIGSTRPITVNVRLIAATHQDLSERVKSGSFRQDLFYRLNVFPVTVPPLRTRRTDISPLAHYFVEMKAAMLGIPAPALPEAELHKLSMAAWPGNVRELEHAIERAMIMSSSGLTSGLHFPELEADPLAEDINVDAGWPDLDQLVQAYIKKVLKHTGGKIKGPDGACALLGIPPSTLRGKMKQYGIELPAGRHISRVRQNG